jgi:hypothetical protein
MAFDVLLPLIAAPRGKQLADVGIGVLLWRTAAHHKARQSAARQGEAHIFFTADQWESQVPARN